MVFKDSCPPGFNVGGGVCIAATLWKILINKNKFVHTDNKSSAKELEMSLKFRAFQWCLAHKLTVMVQEAIWNIDPRSTINNNIRNRKRRLISYWFNHVNIVGWVLEKELTRYYHNWDWWSTFHKSKFFALSFLWAFDGKFTL